MLLLAATQVAGLPYVQYFVCIFIQNPIEAGFRRRLPMTWTTSVDYAHRHLSRETSAHVEKLNLEALHGYGPILILKPFNLSR